MMDIRTVEAPRFGIPADDGLARARRFADTMAARRTVRDFSPEPVDERIVTEAIRAAATAPSGANVQPWRFVVVTDPGLKSRIREAAEAEEREFYGRRAGDEWLAALAPLGTDDSKPFLETAPVLVVVFEVHKGDGEPRPYYVKESVGIAVGLLLAGLHQAGLATLTHTPSPMRFLAELCGRPANERPFVLIPVGYPAPGARVPDIERKPLTEVLVRR
ncbi:nitroreductase [Stackebrandtia albiflava]|uniref:Nitroreductase n=1 Tax=Stackebrandtia albiflava TaxID=406432 RepID=A0A562V1F8_9ACTN|nr:nitroreductase family protein [Stackebrandtia albiflava]TWJ11749.1 nitroreductase [Stackebrandtia albiflava]